MNNSSTKKLECPRILIACEFSGIVREAFRKRGLEAWSCDLLPSEIPSQYHIQGDVLQQLDKGWTLLIGHPPCTFLCRNRARQNKEENITTELEESNSFFMKLWKSDIPYICIENPLPSKMSGLPKYSQIIQPYYFGHDHSKKTCLWLKNLPPLQPTNIIEYTHITTKNGHKYTKGWYEMPRTSTARSRTFTGIADAMAEQWGRMFLPITVRGSGP